MDKKAIVILTVTISLFILFGWAIYNIMLDEIAESGVNPEDITLLTTEEIYIDGLKYHVFDYQSRGSSGSSDTRIVIMGNETFLYLFDDTSFQDNSELSQFIKELNRWQRLNQSNQYLPFDTPVIRER